MKRRLVTDLSYDRLFALLKPYLRYENQAKGDKLSLSSIELDPAHNILTLYTEVEPTKNVDPS